MSSTVVVEYQDHNSALYIESLGPHTVAGIVKDVVEGNYPGTPDGNPVKQVRIIPTERATEELLG